MSRLEQLTKLHHADPADPFCTYGIALEHGKAGRFDEAIAWLDKTLAIDARYAYAYYQKAKMFIEKGDDDAARATLNAGIDTARKAGGAEALHAAEEMRGLLDTLD